MRYRRLPIEIESPEQIGYEKIRCNLTESSFADSALGEFAAGLEPLLLCYGDHLGSRGLRELIAAQGSGLAPDDILITPGAAAALFIAATSLLEKGDRILVVRPNYATNIETPRTLGCEVDFLDLRFENGFRTDPDEIKRRLTPKTKLLSLTVPHNPTGAMMTRDELNEIVRLVEENGTTLLFDETYRDMTFGDPLPMAASLSPRVIGVSSLSKTYGLPGIRTGWLACRDKMLMEGFLAAKEQIVICGSTLDEEIGRRALAARERLLPPIKKTIRAHFEMVKTWMAKQELVEWVEPAGGVVCFPRLKAGVNVERFYKILNEEHGTWVGPGHWFEMERRYFRLGYGWPKTSELAAGLDAIAKAAAMAR